MSAGRPRSGRSGLKRLARSRDRQIWCSESSVSGLRDALQQPLNERNPWTRILTTTRAVSNFVPHPNRRMSLITCVDDAA
jgi:hypothetical protein